MVMNNFTLDNDDTTLLIYSDWLEENGFLSIAEDIRIDVNDPNINEWCYEYHYRGDDGNVGPNANSGARVGSCYAGDISGTPGGSSGVGSSVGSRVGGNRNVGGSVGGSVVSYE